MTLPDPPYTYLARIVSVHDGDTVTADIDLGCSVHRTEHLRLDGINAPELPTKAGKDALVWLATRLPAGTVVLLHTDKDHTEKYGRLLATIYTDTAEPSLNQQLIDAGHAVAWDGHGPRPV